MAETQGNPLALIELPRGLTPAEQVGVGRQGPLVTGSVGRLDSYRGDLVAEMPGDENTLTHGSGLATRLSRDGDC